MRAATLEHYGPSSAISLTELEARAPGPGELRVSVRAASLNPYDWHRLTGTPWLIRNETGWRRPIAPRLGFDVAGEVLAVGAGVTSYAVGDAVFGQAAGALADEVVGRAEELAPIPEGVSFKDAATLPIAGITALQGLRDHGGIAEGASVLINGASGGVGTLAVQLARYFGARVTGVCSGPNAALVQDLGAVRVIDYTREDFTDEANAYDLIVDTVGNRPARRMKRCLRPGGTWVIVSGPKNRVFGPLGYILRAACSFAFNSRRARFFVATPRLADLHTLARCVAEGDVRAVVEREYRLENVVQAFAHLESGRTRGKVLVIP